MSPAVLPERAPRAFRDSRAPGVYEELEFGLPRQVFFSTGVPVFLGTMAHAIPKVARETSPVAHMLSLWSQFPSHIGEPRRESNLASAVHGFFENGGRWCYVAVLKDRQPSSLAAGLNAIAGMRSVDLLCVPDLAASRTDAMRQQQMVLDHCESLGDRFAILDSQPGAKPNEVLEQIEGLDGRNGALYYPWIQVQGFAGGIETVPPCGHVAGVINRIDRARGAHKAPANEVLAGVIDLETRLTGRDQDALNPRGVNCLRSFPGRGIRIWGARTLSGQPEWMYVNVRRLFLTAARWIDWNLAETVFEPNDAKLWARIERKLTEYFAELHRRGALKGATLKEAFYVKCDSETNPSELRDSGRVVTEIGLAPAVPYEFVVVRLIRGARGTLANSNSTTQEIA